MALTGERSDHKIAATANDHTAARELAALVRSSAGLDEAQVRILTPHDEHVGRKLEPENRGILLTMIRAHIWLGLAGTVIGLLAFAILFLLGLEFIVRSPWWAAGLLVVFGTVGGLLLGGAVTLRPDHSPYIAASREAVEAGRYVVVVHASSTEQLKEAESVLRAAGSTTVRSL
jgi:hypothetical protein